MQHGPITILRALGFVWIRSDLVYLVILFSHSFPNLIHIMNYVFSDVCKWSFPPKHRSTGLFVMINCRGFNVTHRVFGLKWQDPREYYKEDWKVRLYSFHIRSIAYQQSLGTMLCILLYLLWTGAVAQISPLPADIPILYFRYPETSWIYPGDVVLKSSMVVTYAYFMIVMMLYLTINTESRNSRSTHNKRAGT